MTERVVVANAGPLIALSAIHRLSLLQSLFGTVFISHAVREEVVTRGGPRPGAREVRDASWIVSSTISNHVLVKLLREQLDAGESETLVLALEMKASHVLLDERLARRKAAAIGLQPVGTLGILLLSKKTGLIPCVEPLLSELEQMSFRMSDSIKMEILRRAGESGESTIG